MRNVTNPVVISFRCNNQIKDKIDALRGDYPRTAWIRDVILAAAQNMTSSDWTPSPSSKLIDTSPYCELCDKKASSGYTRIRHSKGVVCKACSHTQEGRDIIVMRRKRVKPIHF